jgi:hypothetical protein
VKLDAGDMPVCLCRVSYSWEWNWALGSGARKGEEGDKRRDPEGRSEERRKARQG